MRSRLRSVSVLAAVAVVLCCSGWAQDLAHLAAGIEGEVYHPLSRLLFQIDLDIRSGAIDQTYPHHLVAVEVQDERAWMLVGDARRQWFQRVGTESFSVYRKACLALLAVDCAWMYLATDDQSYLTSARDYLQTAAVQTAPRSRLAAAGSEAGAHPASRVIGHVQEEVRSGVIDETWPQHLADAERADAALWSVLSQARQRWFAEGSEDRFITCHNALLSLLGVDCAYMYLATNTQSHLTSAQGFVEAAGGMAVAGSLPPGTGVARSASPGMGVARLPSRGTVELGEAQARGLVRVAARGSGLKSVAVDLESMADEPLAVLVLPGTMFVPASGDTQSMVTREERVVSLPSRGSRESLRIAAACAAMRREVPGSGDRFTVSRARAAPDLIKLLNLPRLQQESFRVQQFAIWTITDNPSRRGYMGIGSFGFGSGPSDDEIAKVRVLLLAAGISPERYQGLR